MNIVTGQYFIGVAFYCVVFFSGCASGSNWESMSEAEFNRIFIYYVGELEEFSYLSGIREIKDDETDDAKKGKLLTFRLPNTMATSGWLRYIAESHNDKFSGAVNHEKLVSTSENTYSSPEGLGFLSIRYFGIDDIYELEYSYGS